METENVLAVVKPKSRGGSKKAKKDDSDDDEDFDIPDLRAQLAKHNIDSSPDHSDVGVHPTRCKNFGYITGSNAVLRRKFVIRITTRSQALDELLGGFFLTFVIHDYAL